MESFTHVLTHLLTKRIEFLVPSARSRFCSLYCPTACLDSGALPVSVYRFLRCLTLWPPLDPSNFPFGMSSHDFCVPGIGPPRLLALNTQKCALTNIKNITEGCGEAVKKPVSEKQWNSYERSIHSTSAHEDRTHKEIEEVESPSSRVGEWQCPSVCHHSAPWCPFHAENLWCPLLAQLCTWGLVTISLPLQSEWFSSYLIQNITTTLRL